MQSLNEIFEPEEQGEYYNLSLFDDDYQEMLRLSQIETYKYRGRRKKSPFPFDFLFFGLAILAMIYGLIYSNVRYFEVSDQLQTAKNQLSTLETDYRQLSGSLKSNQSYDKVEEFAVENLGYCKVSSYQVRYVKIANEDVVLVSEEVPLGISGVVSESFDGVLQYLRIK